MNDLSTYRAALQCKADIERIHARASHFFDWMIYG